MYLLRHLLLIEELNHLLTLLMTVGTEAERQEAREAYDDLLAREQTLIATATLLKLTSGSVGLAHTYGTPPPAWSRIVDRGNAYFLRNDGRVRMFFHAELWHLEMRAESAPAAGHEQVWVGLLHSHESAEEVAHAAKWILRPGPAKAEVPLAN